MPDGCEPSARVSARREVVTRGKTRKGRRGTLPGSERDREALLERYRRWRNLPEMFFEQAAKHASRNFLWAKPAAGQPYQPLTFAETAERVRALAHGLLALGIRPGDRVALVSENRPEWLISDLAIMAAGAVTVPAYTWKIALVIPKDGGDDASRVVRQSQTGSSSSRTRDSSRSTASAASWGWKAHSAATASR